MNSATAKAKALESRLITFAAAILSVSAKLPKTPQARHISNQILRSGTALPQPITAKRAARKADQISFTKWESSLRNLMRR
jgi:hypothetical protein